jgi:hypothetical protein
MYRIVRKYLYGALAGQYQTLTVRYEFPLGFTVIAPESGCPYRIISCQRVRS